MTCNPLEGFSDPPPRAGLAGFTVHVVKQTVLYPIDTIKVRIQAEKADPTRPLWTRGDLFKGCYKGFLVPLVINSPASAVFFAVKDSVKSELKAKIGNPLSTVAAILAAQVPYWLIRQPAEAIKVPAHSSSSPLPSNFPSFAPA
jgi:solute carrier family 25 S-adenosylmethionine transporter 26